MADATTTGTVHNAQAASETPPIAMLLPLFNLALAGSSLVIHLGIRLLLAAMYPLRVIWSAADALLSPIVIVAQIALDIMLFTPFSIVSMVAVALYPIYVFCAVACIFGTIIGVFGRYISTAILSVLARSPYFMRSPGTPPPFHPSGPQVTLRKRKRKSVRLQ